MRRARHRLQVSTFPFLAVLLCTMGALILVLLVMDRRGKAAARMRAFQAAHKIVEEEEAIAAARRAEWERRRASLHAALIEQVAEARSQVDAVQHRASDASASIRAVAARLHELRERLQTERTTLATSAQVLGTQRTTVTEKTKLSAAAQAQLRRIAADLDALERVLADLKAARQRQQSSYSVVPYRGKHGDARKPLYIECSGHGLVFHPDRERLDGYALSPLDIRGVLERRLERHRLVTLKVEPRESKPYLLMLLRPSGVGNYYRTLTALAGLDVDFGYELVDEDWTFEFPEDDRDPPQQAWMSARVPSPAAPEAPSRRTLDGRRISGPWLATPGDGNGPGGIGGVASGVPLLHRGVLGGNAYDPYHPPQYAGGLRGLGSGGGSGRGFGPGGDGTGERSLAQASVGAMPGGPYPGPGGPPGGTGFGPGGPRGGTGFGPGGTGPGLGGPPGGTGFGPGGTGSGPGGPSGGSGSGPNGPGAHGGYAGTQGGGTAQPGNVIAQAGPPSGTGSGRPPGMPGNGTGNGSGPGGGADPLHAPLLTGNSDKPGGNAGTAGNGNGANGSPGTGTGNGTSGSPGTGAGTGSPPANYPNPAAVFATTGSPSGSNGQASNGSDGTAGTASSGGGSGTGSSAGGGASGGSGSPLEGGGGVPGNGLPAGVATAAGAVIPRAPGATPDDNGPPARPPTDPVAGFRPGGSGPSGGGGPSSPSDAPPDPFSRLSPPAGGGKRATQVEARSLERRTGNRDFIIRIECAGDGAIVPAGGAHQIAVSALQRGDGTTQLQQLVREMIDRRQATVRTGEAPFRTQIRFLIRPDGQRTYYLAWPALEALQVPMTCANIGRDDSVEH